MKVFAPHKKNGVRACSCFLAGLVLVLSGMDFLGAKTLKTSYKQYSIFAYQGHDYLCEPYEVKKNDWLYKIFRQKGEISEKDFPFFLEIFKSINPSISNIDAIQPGINILIPLKKVNKNAYDKDSMGNVEVPVVEFSADPDRVDLSPFITKHTIQPGDTVSELLDQAFLKQGGDVSDQGKKVFTHLNPDVRDIHIIHRGTQVKIPDAAILSQSWFESFLEQGTTFMTGKQTRIDRPKQVQTLPIVQAHKIKKLKRYASLIQGTIMNRGTMHFPGKTPLPDVTLDLSRTPVIETGDQGKILILPPGNGFDDLLLKSVKSHWNHLKTMEINRAILEAESLAKQQGIQPRVSVDDVFSTLVPAMGFTYVAEEKLSFSVEGIEMSAVLGRVRLADRPDLLINPGKVFGLALDALTRKGFEILFISPELSAREICSALLVRLGYTTWDDPPFTRKGIVENIPGIYALKIDKRLFVTWEALDESAQDFLTAENIDLIRLN